MNFSELAHNIYFYFVLTLVVMAFFFVVLKRKEFKSQIKESYGKIKNKY